LHQRLFMAELAGLQLVDQQIQGLFVLPVVRLKRPYWVGWPVSGSSKVSMVKDRAADEGWWSSMDRRVASFLAMTAS